MGPIENADLVGLGLTLAAHEYLLPTLDPPSPAAAGLRERVRAGRLSARTGAGFRVRHEGEAEQLRKRLLAHLTGLSTKEDT
jgi:3-hydroxybutyryl-CoA dehydrogenase